MLKGQDQTDTRDFNMKAIVSYLREKPMSCSELALKIGLSRPALTKIVGEMQNLGLLVVTERDESIYEYTMGRKPVFFTVNPVCGYVAAVDFSTVKITIRFCDMQGSVVAQHTIEDREFITYDVLHEIIEEIKAMCERYLPHEDSLYCICLATSGMINRDGVIVLSPKFNECRGLNLREYFQKETGVNVVVKSDIKLLLYGENSANRTERKNTVMLYVDSGIGGAISINQRIVEGESGFAGEFGLTQFSVGDDNIEFDNLASINAMKRAIRNRSAKGEPCCLTEKFRFKDVVAAFKKGDLLVRDVVSNTTDYVAKLIYNISRILDCRKVLIAGRVRQLGEEYLAMIRNRIPAKYPIDIAQNSLGDEAIMIGAINLAIDNAIERIIESR